MGRIDVAIIGAGVVGLAVAAEVVREGREVYVFEKDRTFGRGISDRTSEVIHAGIYYKKGSLKARLCTEGRELIYRINQELVFHKRLGKIIVAVDESEVPHLESILKNGFDNGVTDLRLLDQPEVHEMEPNIRAIAAVYSPSTGIVNAHQLMKHFISKAKEASGGVEPVIYDSEVVGIEKLSNGYKVTITDSNKNEDSFTTRVLINSSGLNSDRIAEMAGLNIESERYRLYFCKGEYFRVNSKHRGKIKRLVYPVPEKAGLGIHATLDAVGEIKLGPNAIYMQENVLRENVLDYKVDESHREEFYRSAKRFLPFLEPDDLSPDQAGVRPKLFGLGMPERDFVIQEESEKELPGLINLVGIESPGLTASPAIGKYVARIVDSLL